MLWYLVHTKPRQERCALHHLEQQGYQCYLPLLSVEKFRQGEVVVEDEALFPRYLFVCLGDDDFPKSLAPIRSTKGVSRLVSFGGGPARVEPSLIEQLRIREGEVRGCAASLYNNGDRVRVTEGAFVGVEGIYQMTEGDRRVLVLIEIMSKPHVMRVEQRSLSKII